MDDQSNIPPTDRSQTNGQATTRQVELAERSGDALPLVSVIVPCHNSARWVATAVQSALDQTHRPVEVIVVDDGSTDDSVAVLKSFGDAIRWETGPNRGACAARNRGMALARGAYLQFLDADDLLFPTKLAAQLAAMGDDENVAGLCEYGVFVGDAADAVPRPGPQSPAGDPIDWLIDKYCRGKMTQTACWLVSAQLAQRAGAWNESLRVNQDGEYFSRVLCAAARVAHVPEMLVAYRRANSASISRSLSRERLESQLASYRLCEQQLLSRTDRRAARVGMARQYFGLACLAAGSCPDLAAAAIENIRTLGVGAAEACFTWKQRLMARTVGLPTTARLIAKRRDSSGALAP
ncbi:MAG: glycosyltransferase family 2 protein [Planctomycetales bacterium]|nr:glycosyltransferase family 2 protein [Planctomycetales bacterium]